MLISSYTTNSILQLLGYAILVRTSKIKYLLKNTSESNGRGPYVIASALKHVEFPNYIYINYILINGNSCYE